MTHRTMAITDYGQELYIKKAALSHIDPEHIEYERRELDRKCMDVLLQMLNHGVKLAVKYERVTVDDVARQQRIYSHRMQVDEIHIRERNVAMFERSIDRGYRRLPSVEIPATPFIPKPKPPAPPAPWHKKLRSFLKQTWDDTGKITGCKL